MILSIVKINCHSLLFCMQPEHQEGWWWVLWQKKESCHIITVTGVGRRTMK